MAPALSETDYFRFRSLIMSRTGLDFPPARRHELSAGLHHALRQITPGLASADSRDATLDSLYRALLEGRAGVWDAVVDALTVCETHFFRNTPQFEALRHHILPGLVQEQRKQGGRTLRVWSAGCASGEEAYSLAILIREVLPDWREWRLDVLGTDINHRALQQARRGIYRDWSFREAYARQWRDHYFTRIGAEYHLHEDVRGMVRFQMCNLVDNCATLRDRAVYFDLILCRNVILYFGTHYRRWIYHHLYRVLRPGGWLIVGHADPAPPNFAAFETHTFPGSTCYRRPYAGVPAVTAPSPPPIELPDVPEPVEAEVLTEEDRTEENNAETHYRLGRWHANRQHWHEALFHCQQAIAADPTCAPAHYTLALIYQSLDASDEAIEALRRTIYLERNWPLPHFTLAGIHRQIGQLEQARRELRNVITLTRVLPPETPIEGGDGLTAARLQAAAERQLHDLAE